MSFNSNKEKPEKKSQTTKNILKNLAAKKFSSKKKLMVECLTTKNIRLKSPTVMGLTLKRLREKLTMIEVRRQQSD